MCVKTSEGCCFLIPFSIRICCFHFSLVFSLISDSPRSFLLCLLFIDFAFPYWVGISHRECFYRHTVLYKFLLQFCRKLVLHRLKGLVCSKLVLNVLIDIQDFLQKKDIHNFEYFHRHTRWLKRRKLRRNLRRKLKFENPNPSPKRRRAETPMKLRSASIVNLL